MDGFHTNASTAIEASFWLFALCSLFHLISTMLILFRPDQGEQQVRAEWARAHRHVWRLWDFRTPWSVHLSAPAKVALMHSRLIVILFLASLIISAILLAVEIVDEITVGS